MITVKEAQENTLTEEQYNEKRKPGFLKLIEQEIIRAGQNALSEIKWKKGMYPLDLAQYVKVDLEDLGFKVVVNEEEMIINWEKGE